MLVLQDADREAQLRLYPRLTFDDPTRMRRVNRENLLRMRNLFAPEQPPIHLIDQC